MNSFIIVVLSVTLLAAFLQSTDTGRFGAAVSTVTNKDNKDLFQFIVHPDTVEIWFRGISHFRAADSKPLGVGKRYEATHTLPMFGDLTVPLHIVKYVPETSIVLESGSLLRPRIEINSSSISDKQSNLTMKITFCRTSYLFQYTIGSFLHAIAHHYIKGAMAVLRQIEEY